MKKEKDKTLVLCPFRKSYVYLYVCQTQCPYITKQYEAKRRAENEKNKK